MGLIMMLTIICPLFLGAILYHPKFNNSKKANRLSLLTILITMIFNIIIAINKTDELKIAQITNSLSISFKADDVSIFFSLIINFIWVLVSIYSLKYFEKEDNNKFLATYLITLAMLMQMCYANNLMTIYLSFEMLSLCSMFLIMYDKSKKSISAALKYLYYSIGGAFLGLFGVFIVLYFSQDNATFVLGGNINLEKLGDSKSILNLGVFLSLLGFGVKAGMFPFHDWLPTAHPIAPSPASAVLSGIITKAGILIVYRFLYESVGIDLIKGTWVQNAWIVIILISILLGSILAVTQENIKKRLAYSSISQLSYIFLGLAMMTVESVTGSFLHVVAHACIKVCLFLCAGLIIKNSKIVQLNKMDGIGKKLPITMMCYTIASLGLIGIPVTSGFISKWYLAVGSLNSNVNIINYLAVCVLIISAIFTAIYTLPLSINAFMPKDKSISYVKEKESLLYIIPLIALVCMIVLVGIYPTPIVGWLSKMFGDL